MTELIYHLAEPGDWTGGADEYTTSSLEEAGFIHCSRAKQLAPVARDLYRSHNSLILLTIDVEGLAPASLVYEDLSGSGEMFPHIYGPLPTSAVVATDPFLTHLEEGMWLQTRFDRDWMDRMLHPDFAEIGMSGRIHTREETIAVSPRELVVELPLEDYRMELVDEDVALVRYVSHDAIDGVDRHAQRTSIWVNTNEGWRLRFHQGTPLP